MNISWLVRCFVTLLSKHRYIITRILHVVLVDYLFNVKYESIFLKFPDNFRTVSSCDGSVRSGSYVFVDINKIGRPCTCTVNSLFVGVILVTSLGVTTQWCNTRVIVNNTVIFYCNQITSSTFKVGVNDKLTIRTEAMAGNNKYSFKQCVGFSEKGNLYNCLFMK